MPRHKSAEKCTIRPWLSAKQDSKEGRFLQIGNSLLLSDQFHELSNGAKVLYICMAMESGGRQEFQFSQAAAGKYGFAPTSFDRSKKELIQAGCIILKSSGRLTREKNEYAFPTDRFKCTK